MIGSFIAKDNREKSRDCPSSSNNPVVSDNRRLDNRNLTVHQPVLAGLSINYIYTFANTPVVGNHNELFYTFANIPVKECQ